MSEENFDKKIREKLSKHSPKYETGAWDSFKKMLPAPWYIRAFRDYGAWLFGGMATTALVLTTIYQSQKTNRLNEEIFTLTEKLNQSSEVDTVFVNTHSVDTVLVKETVTQYVPVDRIVYVDKSAEAKAIENSTRLELEENSPITTENTDKVVASPQNQGNTTSEKVPSKKSPNLVTKNSQEPGMAKSQRVDDIRQNEESSIKEERTVYDGKIPQSDVSDQTEVKNKSFNEPEDVTVFEEKMNDAGEVTELAKPSVQLEELAEEEDTEPKRTDPKEKAKKPVNWPKMRAGISSDYIGFNSLLTGPTVEVFLMDKLSLNTGVLFSRQIETKHPLEMDFNRKTGKRFEEEYGRYIPKENPQIKDISIKTSLIKMPVNFNYYINTWSRFNFMVSAGTKLDLSVYQDVNFSSGVLGSQISRRFEARPKPKVFNNLFYGMGVQYQYRGVVAQLAPYFEFAFRNPDYFTPPRNVGINGSLKFQFGK
ncbi:hypothetical protein [Jiulongibacter sediminis]|uniref:Outer membrane protein beta-barrel domain-containing protein n=1 Tax=Jiulongibacter sediminis TaxID=1605367 RepID=A0A0N8H9Y7_9BACT|nr:hypothetical protein [Jiulongibacter sediminis]KPM48684.1 hypothetical protein AFM12_08805 [Jiulongibacter sediminis]TBX25219.1 hypothetical protein TK44_08810 [Jiulongibacter sediminis]